MKRTIFYLFIATMIMTLFNMRSYAADSRGSCTVIMQKENTPAGGQEPDVDDEGRRAPGRPICCTISVDAGVMIPGGTDNIVCYEIRDAEEGICLFTSTDESAFIDELFSSHGLLMIKLYTEAYSYFGYISIF